MPLLQRPSHRDLPVLRFPIALAFYEIHSKNPKAVPRLCRPQRLPHLVHSELQAGPDAPLVLEQGRLGGISERRFLDWGRA